MPPQLGNGLDRGNGGIRLFDLSTGEGRALRGHEKMVHDFAFDETGQTILTVDIGTRLTDMIYCWDVESGEAYGAIQNPLYRYDSVDSAYRIFATGQRVIVCNIRAPKSMLAVWDLEQ